MGARMAFLLPGLLTAALSGTIGSAAECRIALSLALDVSSSVDTGEYALQANGLAAALMADDVAAAFLAVPGTVVALHVFEWSGRWQQEVLLDWRLIDSAADLAAAAAAISSRPRSHDDFPTALGAAMGFGAHALVKAPPCTRKVLDVSGDGVNNEAFGPLPAKRAFPFADVTVNGLVIGPERAALAEYYRREVLEGPGAFVEEAVDFADFERALRRKLVRELRPPELSRAAPDEPRSD